MILIPVKNLSTAKQRLSPALDHSQRVELAQAMLHDVLEAVGAWASRPPVALVTSDRFAAELAKTFGFEVIPDDNNQSETDAIEMATQVCQSRGLESTLVIPSDIPLVQTWELEKILQAAPPQGSVLVPAAMTVSNHTSKPPGPPENPASFSCRPELHSMWTIQPISRTLSPPRAKHALNVSPGN